MSTSKVVCAIFAFLLPAVHALAETKTEIIRNEKVIVVERTLKAGESATIPADRPHVIVYLDAGSIPDSTSATAQAQPVKRGDVLFRPAQSAALKNAGSSDLRLVSIEFVGKGGTLNWGTSGLAPSYKFLFENPFARVYDVKIAAGTSEPLHTHHDRAVVCLSGAELEHLMSDGQRQTSSLKTGEVVWRPGATHIGQNLGKTDLWVICIEPK